MDKLAALSSSPLFEMLSNVELEYVAGLARHQRFAACEVVFEEGALGDGLYVIVSGEIEVLRRDPAGETKLLVVLTAPEFFGEMSLIDQEYRSATARARTDAEVLHFTAENLATFRNQYRDGFTFVVINIARVLSARLREANTRLAARM